MDNIKAFIKKLSDRCSELKAEHAKAMKNLEQAKITVRRASIAMKAAESEYLTRKAEFEAAFKEVEDKQRDFLISEGKVIEFENQIKDVEADIN